MRRRETYRLTKGKIYRMSLERQKVSFFIVIVFLAIFGIIILAEVLFMEDGKVDLFYDDDSSVDTLWETPKPLEPIETEKNSARLHLSLKRHQEEMERLIRNISASIKSKSSSRRPPEVVQPVLPSFDFQLNDHQGFDATWQPVAGTSHKFYVYSAYYDVRDAHRPLVRVVGVTKTKRSDKVLCRMYHKAQNASTKVINVQATINIIRENWNLKYSACFVICPLLSPKIPTSVSIIAGSASATNQLPVNNVLSGGTGTQPVNSSDIGICVKPIHFHYNKTFEILEFIELNKILGVNRFTFYNHTMSPEVSCLLEHYKEEGTVHILPWQLQVDSQTEIRTEGLFAALNDCLYRNMNHFRYLMLTDFDEFIVPHMNQTLPQMLDYLNSQKVLVKSGQRLKRPKITASYSFQNAFFYLQFPNDEGDPSSLRVLQKTRRKAKFNPQKQRSKYICVPRHVKEAGNHFIWEFQSGQNLNVPTNVGFLHHYRVCEFGGDDCIQAPSLVDKTIHKYSQNLTQNIDQIVRKLATRCNLETAQAPSSTSSPKEKNQ